MASLSSTRVYPPMSHPVADPSVNAVAARFAGLEPPDPARARILEIGCASGHHLLPLAMRWPQAHFTGIDECDEAIQQARHLARLADLDARIDFQSVSLHDFDPGEKRYDYILAHGFFSWVPDPIKQQLLLFCHRHLSENGVAVISFNVSAGWEKRLPIVQKARALVAAALVENEIAALHALRAISTSPAETGVIDDMLAKGADVLAFDDFAPICDPWRLDDFVATAAASGLRWLGESRVSDNPPHPWSEEDERARDDIRETLGAAALHHWMDERCGRTFRSALLCRDDAHATGRLDVHALPHIALRPASPTPPDSLSATARLVHDCLMRIWPSAPWASVVFEQLPQFAPAELALEISHGLVSGWLLGRSEPMIVTEKPPALPALDPLRLACARRGLPVVDAFHQPCVFPAHQIPILTAFDSTRSLQDLKHLASTSAPQLDFDRWTADLNQRPSAKSRCRSRGWYAAGAVVHALVLSRPLAAVATPQYLDVSEPWAVSTPGRNGPSPLALPVSRGRPGRRPEPVAV